MTHSVGTVVTYQGLPAIITAIGDGVYAAIPLTGPSHGKECFGVTESEVAVAGAKVPKPLPLPGVDEAPKAVAPRVRKARVRK